MDRERYEELLADYLGGELSPADRETFEAHLALSPKDREEVEALQQAVEAMQSLPPAPAALMQIDDDRTRVRKPAIVRFLYRPLAYAAMLLIGIGIGWSLRTEPKPDVVEAPPTPQEEPAPSVETLAERDSFVRNAFRLSSAFSRPAG